MSIISTLPSTSLKAAEATSPKVNERIQAEMIRRVRIITSAGPQAIESRLGELDQEWDIERTLEVNAATIAGLGTVLGATIDKRFLVLPAVVTGFLLQHALQGWCPPLPIFRRLGVRTSREIEEERFALKALRGDFKDLNQDRDTTFRSRAEAALEAAER